ncbi:MAG: NCS1 family transporter [Chloroflexota bacterium]|jgi:NCS1 family nucleobase:cation symporter-1
MAIPEQRRHSGELVLSPSRLARQELLPVGMEERNIGLPSFAALWLTMGAQMGVFTLGASLAQALSPPLALLVILIANLAMVAILVLIGDIGIEHGINFAGYLRAPFGIMGSYLPLALRGLSAIAWFGIQTYFGATAIEVVSSQFLGISAFPVWYVAFGILQIAIVAAGIEVIRNVVNAAAPALVVLSVWLLFIMFSQASIQQFWEYPATDPQPLVVGIVASLSYWSTVAINVPDFTRFVKAEPSRQFFTRNRVSFIAQLIGMPTGMLFFTLVGMAGFVFTGEFNPVLAIAALIGGAFLLLALGVVILAQLTTNITANIYASAYAASAIGSPRISYSRGAVITGLMGLFLTFPWVLLDLFLTFLPVVGAALAPTAGVMLSDYYLIRRRRIDVPQIFDPEGQYRYWKGINPASYIAWGAGAIAGITLLDYSFLVALPVALVLYYLLMRFWILKRYRQSELTPEGRHALATSLDRNWPIRMAG